MSDQTNSTTTESSEPGETDAVAQGTVSEEGAAGGEAAAITDAEAAALGTSAGESLADDGVAAPTEHPSVARIASLEADVARLDSEKQDYWNRFLRATADVENVRKRARRDVDDARAEAQGRVLREMLPVIDNLERALQHAENTGAMEDKEAAAVVEGVKLVLRQFTQALERCGVTQLDAVGQLFDPNLHEAISATETADQPPGTVVQALQKGYKLGERLLRPSLVVVAKAPSAPTPAPEPAPAPEAAGESTGEPSDA